MVGCYLVPRNDSNLEIVVAAIDHRIIGAELLIVRYFIIDLESLDGNENGKAIAAAVAK